MYASVRKYQVDPASVSEIRRQVDEEFVPIVSSAPGFIAYYLVDSGSGAIATVSIFENQAGADESNQRAADWVKGLASLIPAPPEITARQQAIYLIHRMDQICFSGICTRNPSRASVTFN